MRADDDDMLPEYDFSNAVRGKYTDRFTPKGREEAARAAWEAMVCELSSHTLRQVRELEGALFTFFVLAGHEPVGNAARRAAAVLEGEGDARDRRHLPEPATPELLAQLHSIAIQRTWVERRPSASARDPDALKAVLERLEAVYQEVRAMRERIVTLIEQHLAGTGLSVQEIERKTEETARLWLAA